MDRRAVLAALGASVLVGRAVRAQSYVTIEWEDLIPQGVPYARIVERGAVDEVADIWKPVFDENATKVVEALDGQNIRLAGYTVPLAYSGDGMTAFLHAPYAGACIHVPPPPANQLVYVTAATPVPIVGLFDAIMVGGRLTVHARTTVLADVGYALAADTFERYQG